MDIDFVRKIDRGCGVPLCFLLSIVDRLLRPFRPTFPNSKPIKKIVFLKFSELGAIILAYRRMARLKREYPDAQLNFVTFERNRGLFNFLENIIPEKNVFLIRENPLGFLKDTLEVLFRLRKEKIDVVFDLEFFSRFSVIFGYLVCAHKRIGFFHYTFEGLYRGDLLTHKIPYNSVIHVAKNFLTLCQEVRRDQKESPELPENIREGDLVFPRYTSNIRARERLLEKFKTYEKDFLDKKIFLINAGEGMLPLREWPVENFAALAQLVLRDPRTCLIMVGTQGAEKKAKQLLDAVADPRAVSWVGQTTLEELLELFSMSEALISNDCGLVHLAMLTPVKTYTLFGPESPAIFGPPTPRCHVLYSHWPCSPCLSALNHRDSACRDNQCLKAITPADVFQAISEKS